MHEIAHKFRSLRPDISITVIGATLDDIGLMRSDNVFVTGAIEAKEFESLTAIAWSGIPFCQRNSAAIWASDFIRCSFFFSSNGLFRLVEGPY